MEFPKESKSHEEVLALLREAGADDVKFKDGRLFALVYGVSDEHTELLGEAYASYISTNGLGTGFIFKSLGKFESEVIGGTLGMLGNPEGAGNITSGGTESIIMGLRAAKEARRAAGTLPDRPEVVVPISAHPAFEKACALMDMELVRTPIRDDTKADLEAFERAITQDTVAAAGSAPNYPYGTVDDIPAMAEIAARADVHFHTDSCVGGFALPWLKRAGQTEIPDFDFRLPGVRTISADIHKYGFAARGTSLVLYRDQSLAQHAVFRLGTWIGGPYFTPTLAGSRPGGAVAAAWAVVQRLGQDGYTRIHTQLRETTLRYMAGAEAAGFRIVGDPPMSLFSFCTDDPALDINAVGDEMLKRGWFILRQPTDPPSMHLLVTPKHEPVCERFCSDLAESAQIAKSASAKSAQTSNYTAES